MNGGLNFGAVKAILATVVNNGVCSDDPDVLTKTNEATLAILSELIPIGGMATYDVVADGTTLLLPKELENAIEVEVQGMGTVNSSSDVKQGWYDIVNNFTYVDPNAAHDNPLVDEFLQPDPTTPSILRRQYDYPGLTPNATVRVTGAKRYIPLTGDNDYLIVQNTLALKYMIQSIWESENNGQNAQVLHDKCIALLTAEVKKHQLDPRNTMKRKANYEADMVNFSRGTMGWTRARLALEVPGAMAQGKSQLTRILEMAEMRLLEMGTWKDSVQNYQASVTGGMIYFPAEVGTVLAVDICGMPIPIRSEFYEYAENGPGISCQCSNVLIDQGEDRFVNGDVRRLYKLTGNSTTTTTISVVAKKRWVPKAPTDFMTIKNWEALRLMVLAIVDERSEKWQEAIANQEMAKRVLNEELHDFLRGIKFAPVIETCGFGMGDIGSML